MKPFRASDARRLADALSAEGVMVPCALEDAIALADACDAARQQPQVRALDLDLEAGEHLDHARALVLHDGRLIERLTEIADQGAAEAADALRADDGLALDLAIEDLRPAFDEAAEVVTEAAALGITSTTTDADVLERDDPRVVDAWRALLPAIATLDRITAGRALLCDVLGVAADADSLDWLKLAAGGLHLCTLDEARR